MPQGRLILAQNQNSVVPLLCKEQICVGHMQQCVLHLEQSTRTASKQLKRLEGAFVPRHSSLQFVALVVAVGLIYAAKVPQYHAAHVLKHCDCYVHRYYLYRGFPSDFYKYGC